MRRFAVRESDVVPLAEILILTTEQKESVIRLRDGHAAALEVYAKRFIEREQAVADAERGSEDRRKKSEVRFEAMCELWNKRWSGGREFRRDVQSLLNAEQTERWGRAERFLRRDLMVGMTGATMTKWCQLDVVELVRSQALSPEDQRSLNELVERYEVDVDLLLSSRERRPSAAYPIITAELLNPKPDPHEEQWYNDNTVAVGRVNRQYARRVAEQLGPERGKTIADAARRLAYFYVYDSFKRHGADLMKRALGLEDLSLEQRGKLGVIEREYARDSEKLHNELIALLDEAEDEYVAFRKLPQEEHQRRYESGDYPAGKAWREGEVKRDELEERTLERINVVLTVGQRKLLEKPEKPESSP